jgi:hypothetical protein
MVDLVDWMEMDCHIIVLVLALIDLVVWFQILIELVVEVDQEIEGDFEMIVQNSNF